MRLSDIDPGDQALSLAAEQQKDPRAVEIVLSQTARIVRHERGVMVCETHHGLVCANAGVDFSNVCGVDEAVLLPRDPDRSARELRDAIARRRGVRPGVLITDSFGRAWRVGQTDVAIGAAGVRVLDDWRGRLDSAGRELRATVIAAADSLAAAADLVRAKDARLPAVVISGAENLVTRLHGPGATALKRPRALDLFR